MTDYTRHNLRAITRFALEQVAGSGTGIPEDQEKRELARAALAQLDHKQPERRELIWRQQVQPGLWVVVEDSHNVLLEVTTPDGSEIIARTDPLAGNDLAVTVTVARVKVAELDDVLQQARHQHLSERAQVIRWSEPRDGEDAASRKQAASVLADAGLSEHAVALVLKRAYGHLSASANTGDPDELAVITYDRDSGEYTVALPASQVRKA